MNTLGLTASQTIEILEQLLDEGYSNDPLPDDDMTRFFKLEQKTFKFKDGSALDVCLSTHDKVIVTIMVKEFAFE